MRSDGFMGVTGGDADAYETVQDLRKRPGREAESTPRWGAKWGAIVSRHRATQSDLKRSIPPRLPGIQLQWPKPSDTWGLVRIEGVNRTHSLVISAFDAAATSPAERHLRLRRPFVSGA